VSHAKTTRADFQNRVLHGDAFDVLRSLPSGAVDCTVTSPPYYRQRDYANKKQLGQEASPQAYIDRIVSIFAEVRRVTAKTGSLWLNLGDKYESGELLGLPWRVALALADEGWILRSDCIWQKPNAMPSPVTNRPTTDHEYLFFFAKSNDYFYDADAVREPHVTFSDKSKMKGGRKHFGVAGGTPEQGKNAGSQNLHRGRWDQAFHPLGRNKRTVWSISLSKFRDAHFAVFPEALVETCIKASCPEKGVVLDPFCGSGTTLLVSQRLGRSYVGMDCARKYVAMARKRLSAVQPSFE
jgi:DNA modification methylase